MMGKKKRKSPHFPPVPGTRPDQIRSDQIRPCSCISDILVCSPSYGVTAVTAWTRNGKRDARSRDYSGASDPNRAGRERYGDGDLLGKSSKVGMSQHL
ncbi:hypothetical protein VTL71DRAFT_10017 [Oculimacula yallundae]|uniref:Uncharacterized protein n=1 Tax=Oculimacula yallundae TaxID=86028 RepID=A0ABR4BQ33_9HELO